jgi:hypothetical protein
MISGEFSAAYQAEKGGGVPVLSRQRRFQAGKVSKCVKSPSA